MIASRLAFAAFAVGLGVGAAVPALASEPPAPIVQQVQFYDPPFRGDDFRGREERRDYGRPRFDEDDDFEERPRRRYRGDDDRSSRFERRVSIGETCETSRGSCQARPAPIGAGCRCVIPGFGVKRGNISD